MKTIPFNIEKWKAGAKVVYRSGAIPLSVIHLPEVTNALEKIITITPRNEIGLSYPLFHKEDGRRNNMHETDFDLLLLVEPKEIPLDMYDFIDGKVWWISTAKLMWATSVDYVGSTQITTDGSSVTYHDLRLNYLRTNGTRDSEGKLVWQKCSKEEI